MSDIELGGYVPGAIGRVTEMHARYYSRHWGFTRAFEVEVAGELAEFMGRFDERSDGFWVAREGEKIVGSIAIDGHPAQADGARLRWFILDEAYQGRGIGKRLLTAATGFCARVGFPRVYLWTFSGLDDARRLYERFGFVLRSQHENSAWGRPVHDLMFDWIPPRGPAPSAAGEAARHADPREDA
jgi:GNAT superfamily N-acetyltransferase